MQDFCILSVFCEKLHDFDKFWFFFLHNFDILPKGSYKFQFSQDQCNGLECESL